MTRADERLQLATVLFDDERAQCDDGRRKMLLGEIKATFNAHPKHVARDIYDEREKETTQ